jgi:diketogulonate reductase-like aldo/keto reductase
MIAFPASAQTADTAAAPKPAERTVKFPDGTAVPALGQGSWHLGQGRHSLALEQEALRIGISLGMRVIDTSENYGNGSSEELIGQAIAGRRDDVFLVSKIEPESAFGAGFARSCQASLARLRTDHLDLYLLHAPVSKKLLPRVVAGFEQLRAAGKIRAWGVSNFNVAQMDDLISIPDGHRCATNQVIYNLSNRHIERDVLPWCQQHNMPVMAYSPLGGDNGIIVRDRSLERIGAAHGCSAAALALAWVMRSGNVIAIPEAGTPAHVKDNAVALSPGACGI